MYKWEDEITEEPEVVMVVKTSDNKYDDVKLVVQNSIDYTNFIGELEVKKVNDKFTQWLNSVVK